MQQPQQYEQDITSVVKDLMRRVRVLEERLSGMRKNVQVNEQNMLQWNRKVIAEVKASTMDMAEMKAGIQDMKEKMIMVIKELRETAKKEDVQVMQKYIQLWEPLNFVTHNELERAIQKK